jgi:citronellol/citronellal dehydrogenase
LLDGRGVALAGGPPAGIKSALTGLGARVETFDPARFDPERADDEATEWAVRAAPLHALVYDAAATFADGGQTPLRDALDRAWVATRAVATGALIPSGAGKVLLIAPVPAAGSFAVAARAALENLARTLSVEWARYGVTTAAIAPGARTTEQELAELVCFLASPAGEYFSGCAFELDSGEGMTRP